MQLFRCPVKRTVCAVSVFVAFLFGANISNSFQSTADEERKGSFYFHLLKHILFSLVAVPIRNLSHLKES